MSPLVPLAASHLDAVLVFERDNRAWFARWVTDRGDDYYATLADHHRAQLDEQAAGECAFHVLLDDDGSILGRFNLYGLRDGRADAGYRMAERATGRGLATRSLLELCERAASQHGLARLNARTSVANLASQRVLVKAGFEETGPCPVAGRPGLGFTRRLGPPALVSTAP